MLEWCWYKSSWQITTFSPPQIIFFLKNFWLISCSLILCPCSCLFLLKALIDLCWLNSVFKSASPPCKDPLNSNVSFQHSCSLPSKVSSTWFISQICTPHHRSGWGQCSAYLSWERPLGNLTWCSFPFWQKPRRAALWVRLCHWFYTYPWIVTSPCFLRLLRRISQALVSQILLRVKIYGIYCLSPLPKAHYLSHKEIK